MIAGAGIGTMVIGIQLDWMVDMFGWRGAMFIQAGLALQVCISACLIFKLPSPPVLEHNGLTTDDLSKANNNTNNQHVSTPSTASSDISIRTLIRQPLFWLTVMSLMAIQTNFATMGTILKDFTINIGLQDSFKTLLLVMGLSNTVSRIVAGPICNLIAAPILFSVVSILFAGVNVLLIYCDVEWALLAVGSGFGLCQGTILVTWVVKIAWIYGQKEMPIVRGYVMFFGIITGLTIPPVIGKYHSLLFMII